MNRIDTWVRTGLILEARILLILQLSRDALVSGEILTKRLHKHELPCAKCCANDF